MGSLMHLGQMCQALDSSKTTDESRRWLEVESWSDRVLIRLGKATNEEHPESTLGVSLTAAESRKLIKALQEAMARAGHTSKPKTTPFLL